MSFSADAAERIALVIHGGAGSMSRESLSKERDAAFRKTLDEALSAGWKVLQEGGSSLDGVEAAIVVMEDSPLFNAGKGAVFTSKGENELDASIMDGRNRNAGAVGSIMHVKNPIRAARAVLERSPHVMLIGEGADAFAEDSSLDMVEREYFHTERRWKQWQEQKDKGFAPKLGKPKPSAASETFAPDYLGTVGAVALDREGNLAAGTSTGGLTNKGYGRIGDSPIIGAGTYADNATCAISCTGHGEYFIRYAVAHDISARMRYRSESLRDAARTVVHETLKNAGGRGGVIGVDAQGNVVAEFNTSGMFRAWIDADGNKEIHIFK